MCPVLLQCCCVVLQGLGEEDGCFGSCILVWSCGFFGVAAVLLDLSFQLRPNFLELGFFEVARIPCLEAKKSQQKVIKVQQGLPDYRTTSHLFHLRKSGLEKLVESSDVAAEKSSTSRTDSPLGAHDRNFPGHEILFQSLHVSLSRRKLEQKGTPSVLIRAGYGHSCWFWSMWQPGEIAYLQTGPKSRKGYSISQNHQIHSAFLQKMGGRCS